MPEQPTPVTSPASYRRRSNRRGFSLIELMVVIVIIGILGTSAVFFFGGAADDAKVSRALNEIRQFVDGIGIYKTKFGQLPRELTDLNQLKDLKIPDADPWGRPYQLKADDQGFEVLSHGANETDASDDVYYTSESNKYHKPGDKQE